MINWVDSTKNPTIEIVNYMWIIILMKMGLSTISHAPSSNLNTNPFKTQMRLVSNFIYLEPKKFSVCDINNINNSIFPIYIKYYPLLLLYTL